MNFGVGDFISKHGIKIEAFLRHPSLSVPSANVPIREVAHYPLGNESVNRDREISNKGILVLVCATPHKAIFVSLWTKLDATQLSLQVK